MNHNILTSLNPEATSGWQSLIELIIQNNNLSHFPSEIGMLQNLQLLDVSNNKLTYLPTDIGKLTHLVECQMTRNMICSIPGEIGGLESLQFLDLSYNQIEELPHEFGLLRSLQILNLSNNKMSAIPRSFGALINLEVFSVTFNSISNIPETFSNLQKLTSLDFSCNKVNDSNIVVLNKLSSTLSILNLSSNNLRLLPKEGFTELYGLQNLNLSHNLLEALPFSFLRTFSTVENIDISRNPFNLIPITFNGTKSISPNCLSNWLEVEALIYDICADEWNNNYEIYMNHERGLKEFIDMSLMRIKGSCNRTVRVNSSVLFNQIQSFYEHCKRIGITPCYHKPSIETEQFRKDLMQSTHNRIKQNLERTNKKIQETNDQRNTVYFNNLENHIQTCRSRINASLESKDMLHKEELENLREEVEQRRIHQDKKAEFIRNKLKSQNLRNAQKWQKHFLVAENHHSSLKNNHLRALPLELKPCWKR